MASTLETLLSIQGATEQLSIYSIPEDAREESKSCKSQPPKRKSFLDGSGTRNYNGMYRIVHDFHERHNPPGIDAEYWTATAEDMAEIAAQAGNDPFLEAMLSAVYAELARESDRLRAESRAEQKVS